ncbi:hypothetical protein, partial [Burkholderia multivorans]|uniref:hypothetical protein n=1 Tax=Burkholderia multivorans TaxID=87883 RepID=UPI001C6138E1
MSVEPYENCFFIGGRGLAAKRFQTIDRTRRAKNPRFKTREFLMPFLGRRCQAPSATAESLKGVAGLGELFQHG